MKALHLFLVVFFTLTLSLSAISGDVQAAADKQEVVAPAEKAATPKVAADEKSKNGKAIKGIPKDVDINTADKDMLTLLPGIGPVTADAIVAYRKTNGNFKSIDELTKVKGIGEKTLVKLKPFLKAV